MDTSRPSPRTDWTRLVIAAGLPADGDARIALRVARAGLLPRGTLSLFLLLLPPGAALDGDGAPSALEARARAWGAMPLAVLRRAGGAGKVQLRAPPVRGLGVEVPGLALQVLPTVAPTRVPTVAPTRVPTVAPTRVPTCPYPCPNLTWDDVKSQLTRVPT